VCVCVCSEYVKILQNITRRFNHITETLNSSHPSPSDWPNAAVAGVPEKRVLTHPAIWALLRLRLIIQTSLLGSYKHKSA